MVRVATPLYKSVVNNAGCRTWSAVIGNEPISTTASRPHAVTWPSNYSSRIMRFALTPRSPKHLSRYSYSSDRPWFCRWR